MGHAKRKRSHSKSPERERKRRKHKRKKSRWKETSPSSTGSDSDAVGCSSRSPSHQDRRERHRKWKKKKKKCRVEKVDARRKKVDISSNSEGERTERVTEKIYGKDYLEYNERGGKYDDKEDKEVCIKREASKESEKIRERDGQSEGTHNKNKHDSEVQIKEELPVAGHSHFKTFIDKVQSVSSKPDIPEKLVPRAGEAGFSQGDRVAKEEEGETESDRDSEEDLMFDWETHRYDLDRMFFGDNDPIQRGTEDHRDFWVFLKKYQSLQKQQKIREMCGRQKSTSGMEGNSGKKGGSRNSVYNLPCPYNKQHSVNFGLSLVEVEVRRGKLPPRDLEDGRAYVPTKRLREFQMVLLLYLDFIQKQKFEKLRKLREAQASLPIAAHQEEIVSLVRQNRVVIVAGDTGCGKSTQVPQYLLAAGYGHMACTQPRRIACIALAKRVAYETLNEFGSQVGYQIRFEKSRTEHTKIVFMTEGLLLRQVSAGGGGGEGLSQYEVVILDEVHERHLDTDLLLGVVRVLVGSRPDLRVVLMSATINLELFVRYFQGRAPVVQVPGRLHPITLQYLPIPSVDLARKKERLDPGPYVRVLQLVDNKYPKEERGDLLIFLSGVSEIGTVVEAAREYGEQSGRWVVLPLHSTLPVAQQEKVFHVPPEGVRKCIVSTNIAETSVTIDGVRFVVDSGKVKEMSYDPQSKMRRLKEFWISQASAEQRKGRAGRTGPGTCFRLYSQEDYDTFAPYSSPEVQRVPLDSLVLRLASMGLPDTRLFPFIEPPPPDSLEHALTALKAQHALTPGEALTTLGRLLALLPVDVALGKMLIMGSLFHQVEAVLSLAAVMSVQSPFTPRARRDPDCLTAIKELESDHGDPFTLLAAYREWVGVKQDGGQDSRAWCRRRGLEQQRFYETTKLRHQFSRLLHDSGLHNIGGADRTRLTGAERVRRNGQLRQLHQLKSQLRQEEGPRKPKVLRMGQWAAGGGDSDDEKTDIKDVDFRIKHDHRQLEEIRRGAWVRTARDLVILKLVLCSGLYPNLAIADLHNNYKPGSEQFYHTPAKPFAILHPTGVYSAHPEVLKVPDSEIFEVPGCGGQGVAASTRHQLLAYVSLLETNKVYLVDTLRLPAAQTLLLFARAVDTNADMTRVACDAFIELRFPDAALAQNLIFRAVHLRAKWQRLLDLRIEASGALRALGDGREDSEEDVSKWEAEQERQERLGKEADLLERDLTAGLVDFYHSDCLYSQHRLLAADASLLYSGPGPSCPFHMHASPFSEDVCRSNTTKGGLDLTDFLTYDCLLETECEVFSTSSYDTICPYCEAELHLTTLERLSHMTRCVKNMEVDPKNRPQEEEEDQQGEDDPRRKKYDCEVCGRSLRLTLKEIFQHKNSHQH